MRARTGLNTALTAALILGATGLSAPAFAHGDKGAHVDAFETHLDDYEQEIEQLVATVDSIASDYAGDGVASEQLDQRADALVDDWEHVDFHEALETHAIALYPPIWVALGGLEEATLTGERSQAVRVDPEAAEHGVETERHAYLYPPGPRNLYY